MQTFEKALSTQRMSFWSWNNLCWALKIMNNNFVAATVRCEDEMNENPHNPAPAMVLFNSFSVEGKYELAMKMYMKMWENIGQEGLKPVIDVIKGCFIMDRYAERVNRY